MRRSGFPGTGDGGCCRLYGLLLNPVYIPNLRGAWSGGWVGVFNTYFWVDRTTGICASIYTNSVPFLTIDALKLYGGFEAAL
jgi:methyl acetate hydrolase